MKLFSKLFKDPNTKVIEKMQPMVAKINAFEEDYKKLTDEGLRAKTILFKEWLSQGKEVNDMLAEAFAASREANRRAIGISHYDVQLVGGMVLNNGEIAEMKTGEGKTHVASLAAYLNALEGKGVHVITVNDYLAQRDAGWNGPANELLGLSTACLINQQALIYDKDYENPNTKDERLIHLKPCTRKEAYAADITYGTNSEFGFDYLRDNMAPTIEAQVQRGLHYAIIDEVDSVLIDEARTPLIISAPAEESAKMYQQFSQIVPKLKENEDYNIDEKMKAVTLSDEGIEKVQKILGVDNIYTEGGITKVHHLEQALKAQVLFKKDKDYVEKNGEIIIIDEFTGRLMQGRRYSEGLHQAIEAKEGVEVKKESRTLATVTLQNYFRMYDKLSGMTGTALTEAEEFSKIYSLDVTEVPTHRDVVRKDLTDRIYSTTKGKYLAVAREIKELQEKGQPVLVGTISIEQNELLSSILKQEGIVHEVLNAKQHDSEADVIAQAGRVGSVTVATNMAGRGVDIILGGAPFNKVEYEKVKELGGLFVVGTERHESRRIDNQLRGRSGRQGDPGETRFYVSLDDDLMRIFGSDRVKGIMKRLGLPEDQPIENKMISNSIEKAQQKVEGNNFDIRKHLVEYDDVINKQREIIYSRRKEVLDLSEKKSDKLKTMVLEMVENEIEQVVSFHTAGADQSQWNMKEIGEVATTIFPLSKEETEQLIAIEKIAGDKAQDAEARTKIIEYLINKAKKHYDTLESDIKEQSGSDTAMRLIEKEILIRSIDNLWVDHLDAIDALRTGIGLRGY
ncbi:preprotein translocase subunit SecA, partial [Candidatus Falkowbacteria bacterium]|nr:preprotein translocase subunit SecA [Candidatus Falkowbacteria bacterium]